MLIFSKCTLKFHNQEYILEDPFCSFSLLLIFWILEMEAEKWRKEVKTTDYEVIEQKK